MCNFFIIIFSCKVWFFFHHHHYQFINIFNQSWVFDFVCVYTISLLLVPTNTVGFGCRLNLKWGFPIQAHSLTNLKWVRKFCQPQQHPTQLRLVRVHMTWHSCYASSPHYCFRLHVSLSLSLSLCAVYSYYFEEMNWKGDTFVNLWTERKRSSKSKDNI